MVYPCSRVATSFTGRPSRRAATAIQAVRADGMPFEPKAPPTWRETTRMRAIGTPSCFDSAPRRPCTNWLGSYTVRLPSCQAAVVVNSSIGLWCWVGVA